MKRNGSAPYELCVMATGGGAYKFYDMLKDALVVNVLREDEMECLIIGVWCDPFFPCAIWREPRANEWV